MEEVAIANTCVIDDLAKLKTLADPLRIRILESLVDEARTTKQVAERLGEKPTKLYHHVDALEKAGFIRLERTRPNRGTLEKYFRAVARVFQAAPQAFAASGVPEDSWQSVASELFRHSSSEVLGAPGDGEEPPALVADLRVAASEAEIRRIRDRVEASLRALSDPTEANDDASGDPSDRRVYRLVVGFFPMTDAAEE
ncbi:MAG: winged helix-turn-helix domain-containing protein [Planctomycetota bacterium]